MTIITAREREKRERESKTEGEERERKIAREGKIERERGEENKEKRQVMKPGSGFTDKIVLMKQ